jgi:glycine/D-amino acid oxidase-like deaminating enzyme|eukprot:COSAG01_NODE_5896_length_3965_cov_2.419296_2_plen_337_part_00
MLRRASCATLGGVAHVPRRGLSGAVGGGSGAAATEADVVVVGGGIAGCAAAYHLARRGAGRVLVISAHTPLTLTSAYSTECYRDFWPSPAMASFMGRSIDLMEQQALESGNAFDMGRRGYAYFTSSEETFAKMVDTCRTLHEADPRMQCVVHTGDASTYQPGEVGSMTLEQLSSAVASAGAGEGGGGEKAAAGALPRGLDLLRGNEAVRAVFPEVGEDVVGCLHARRAGWVSAQQYGMTLLGWAKELGVEFVSGEVVGVDVDPSTGRVSGVRWVPGLAEVGVPLTGAEGGPSTAAAVTTRTPAFVNAGGPCLNQLHRMLPGRDGMAPEVVELCGGE